MSVRPVRLRRWLLRAPPVALVVGFGASLGVLVAEEAAGPRRALPAPAPTVVAGAELRSAVVVSAPPAPARATGPPRVRDDLEARLVALTPERAREELDRAFASGKDADERLRLIAIARRLQLRASPLELADAKPDALRGAIGPRAIPEHRLLLLDPTRSAVVRQASADALARAGDRRAREALLEALRGPSDPQGRALAARALGSRRDVPAVQEALTLALGDPVRSVRDAAARALAR